MLTDTTRAPSTTRMGPITIHCAAMLSAQCNELGTSTDMESQQDQHRLITPVPRSKMHQVTNLPLIIGPPKFLSPRPLPPGPALPSLRCIPGRGLERPFMSPSTLPTPLSPPARQLKLQFSHAHTHIHTSVGR